MGAGPAAGLIDTTRDHQTASALAGSRWMATVLPTRWPGRLLLLAAILICIMVVIGPGVFSIDEAAYRFQAELIQRDQWGLPYPTGDLVERSVGAPLVNSELGFERWYPAARHPAYVWLLATASAVAGPYGPVLVSLVGLALFAVGVERLCLVIGGVPTGLGFWAGALAGPVTVHGFIGWAHAPAAGLVAIGLALLLQAAQVGEAEMNARAMVMASLGAVTVAGSVLLRGDGPIAVAAIGCGFAAVSYRHRSYLPPAVAVIGGGAAAYLLSDVWHAGVVEAGALVGPGSARGLSLSRYWHSVFEILISPGSGGRAMLRISAVALLAIGVLWIRRHRSHATTEAWVLAAAVVVTGGIGAIDVVAYGSLLPACPLLVLGLAGAGIDRRSGSSSAAVSALGLATVFGIGGPILASVSAGGGLGWGGRYVLLALPAALPLALRTTCRLWRRREAQPLIVAAAILTAIIQLAGARTLFEYHRLSLDVTEAVEQAIPSLAQEFDVIIAVDARVGRLAASTAASIPLVSVVDVAKAEEVLATGLADDVDRVAVVSYMDPMALEPPPGWRFQQYRDEPLQVAVLERR